MVNYALMTDILGVDVPSTFKEASKNEKWKVAIHEENHSIERNGISYLVKLPNRKKANKYKRRHKAKFRSDSSIKHHTTQQVAKGFKQIEGIDYGTTFALGTYMHTIKRRLAQSA